MRNPFLELLGAQLVLWEPDHCEWALDVIPDHLNTQGSLHGGVIATLLDVACGYSGFSETSDTRAATLSLTVQYLAKASHGHLRARAWRRGGGKRIFFAEAELIANETTLVATASGSFCLQYPRVSI